MFRLIDHAPMRIRLIHKEKEAEEPGVELEPAAVEVSNAELLASNKRLVRVAYYSATVSVLVMIAFVWLSNYDSLTLDRRMSLMQAEATRQLDARLATLSAGGVNPKPQPQYADIQIPPNAPRLGDANAKVTIVEFSDFQCPYCGKFQEEVYPFIKQEYVDTGKASFVYLDFAFLGEESKFAAQAAKCAAEQGKFWEYHDFLFKSHKGENQGAFGVAKLKGFARGVVPNTFAFNQCLDSNRYEQAVLEETALGRAAGVAATPTVLINGKLVVGALPYAAFKQEIEAALGK